MDRGGGDQPAAVAFAVALTSIGLVNLAHYGRFAINEIKDRDFVAAMGALQRASYHESQPYLPVAKAADSASTSTVPPSPSCRPSSTPRIDRRPGTSPAGTRCYTDTSVETSRLAGSLWALREGVHRVGAHRDPHTAAAFFRAIADEVDAACAQGELRWATPCRSSCRT